MHLPTSITYKKIISNISRIGYHSQTLLRLFQEAISKRTKEAKQSHHAIYPTGEKPDYTAVVEFIS
jgi:DNA topoisomerase IA